jgi:hypothetical protein
MWAALFGLMAVCSTMALPGRAVASGAAVIHAVVNRTRSSATFK